MGEGYNYEPESRQGQNLLTYNNSKSREMKEKLNRLMQSLSENKKVPAIAMGLILLLIVGGTFTGNYMKTNSELDTCQGELSDCYVKSAELSGKVNLLEDARLSLQANVNSCETQKNALGQELTVCQQQRASQGMEIIDLKDNVSQLFTNLNFCNKDLGEAQTELAVLKGTEERLQKALEKAESNLANYRCCDFYDEGYRYYIMEDDRVRCCYKSGSLYTCGFGPSAEEYDEDDIKKLSC
jgi:DNA repair exonuclease SbcCD ATPase subunit